MPGLPGITPEAWDGAGIALVAGLVSPLTFCVTTIGAMGLKRKYTQMNSQNKKLLEIDDSKNNKIQSTIAAISCLAVGFFTTILTQTPLIIGCSIVAFSLAGSVIIPHVLKLFTSSEATRKKLDNFAGTIGTISNLVGGICLSILSLPFWFIVTCGLLNAGISFASPVLLLVLLGGLTYAMCKMIGILREEIPQPPQANVQ